MSRAEQVQQALSETAKQLDHLHKLMVARRQHLELIDRKLTQLRQNIELAQQYNRRKVA